MDCPNFKLRRSASYPLLQTDMKQHSATRHYSLRDINDQILALRKENFNLKLDLFLLRERYSLYGHRNGEGNDLISYKLEIERLRKELTEKNSIIKDALEEIRQIEKIEDEIEQKYEVKVEVLQQKIKFLEESNAEKLKKIFELSGKLK